MFLSQFLPDSAADGPGWEDSCHPDDEIPSGSGGDNANLCFFQTEVAVQREIDTANGFLLDTYCLVCQESTTVAIVEGRRGTAVVCKYTHAAVRGVAAVRSRSSADSTPPL